MIKNKLVRLTVCMIAMAITVSSVPMAASASHGNGSHKGNGHHAYVSGYDDGSFKPDHSITRAEVAQILYSLDAPSGSFKGTSFSDIAKGAWYYDAVCYLESLDIVGGYGDGTFRPNATITRSELVTMLGRYSGISGTAVNKFSDVSDSHWAKKYIAGAVKSKWVSGYPDGTFRPENSATRAETVTITNRMLNVDVGNIPENSAGFLDVSKDHWAYDHILQAYYDPANTISSEQAIQAALNAVGGGTVTGWRFDYINGVLAYKVWISKGQSQLAVEVDAFTGAVLRSTEEVYAPCAYPNCGLIGGHNHGICNVVGCDNAGNHSHNGVNYTGHHNGDGHGYHNYCGVSGCNVQGNHNHSSGHNSCGVSGCNVQGNHNHNSNHNGGRHH